MIDDIKRIIVDYIRDTCLADKVKYYWFFDEIFHEEKNFAGLLILCSKYRKYGLAKRVFPEWNMDKAYFAKFSRFLLTFSRYSSFNYHGVLYTFYRFRFIEYAKNLRMGMISTEKLLLQCQNRDLLWNIKTEWDLIRYKYLLSL